MTKVLFSISFILLYVVSYSQTGNVVYTVLSTEELNPVSGAEVCLSIDSEKQCFLSDENGKISTDTLKEGVYSIEITKEGFEPYQETIDLDNTSKTFYLWKNNIELEELVIEIRKSNLNRSFGTTTLKIDDNSFFQNTSFEDIVSIIPEVSVNNDKISVLGKNRVLYLINGRETTRNITQLQSNQIEKIEVVSNPSSKYQANYDAVINIVLKKNENRGLFLNLNSNLYQQKKFISQ